MRRFFDAVLSTAVCIGAISTIAHADTLGTSQHFLNGGDAVPTGRHEAVGRLPGCTASYIGNQKVLTAAHCVCPTDDQPTGCQTQTTFQFVDVQRRDDPATGVNESASRGNVTFVGDVRVYRRYGAADTINGPRAWLANDFAVLTLTQPVGTLVRNLTPLKVEKRRKTPRLGDPLTLVGFGLTGNNCSSPSMGKREITLPLWERSTGNVTLRIGTSEMGACPGDSGGPALNQAGLITGVSSSIPGNYDPVDLAQNFIAGFEDLGGHLGGAPTATRTTGNRIELFARGRHGGELVQRSWNGQSWSGWKNLGGDILGAPSVVHIGGGRLEVFVRGKHNDELVQRSWDGRRWSGWKNLGGDIAAGPSAIHTGDGRIEVFVRGKHNDELVQRSWNGSSWSGWKNLGGDINAAPAAVYVGGGRMEVFVRGRHNDELVQRSWNGVSWSGWKNLGGDIASAPAAIHTGNGRLKVFVRGKHNDELVERSWNGQGWSGWKNHGGDLTEAPAAILENGGARIFSVGQRDELLSGVF
ncbi:MAG: trypsin-like serine protease [Pseudomonadota bacterium]